MDMKTLATQIMKELDQQTPMSTKIQNRIFSYLMKRGIKKTIRNIFFLSGGLISSVVIYRTMKFFRKKKVEKPNPYKMARDIKKLKKGEAGREWNTHDSSQSSTVGTSMVLTHLSAMEQGTTSLTRIGLKIRAHQLRVMGTIAQNASATAPTVVRQIIMQDTEQHGVDPTLAQILEGTTPTVRDFPEHDNRQRFRFLYDKLYVLNERVASTSFSIPIRIKKKLGGRVIHYIGTGATAASLGKNNLYMVLLSNDNTNPPTVSLNMRLRFTD